MGPCARFLGLIGDGTVEEIGGAVPRKGGGIGGGANKPVGMGGGTRGVRGRGEVRLEAGDAMARPDVPGIPPSTGEPSRPGMIGKPLLLAIWAGNRLGSEVTGVPESKQWNAYNENRSHIHGNIGGYQLGFIELSKTL